jgi:hypothetical protein
MKMRKLGSLALIGALSLGSACSGDGITVATGDTMTAAEFEQMGSAYSELGAIMFQALLDETSAGPGGIAAQGTVTFDRTVECPAGGTARITGSAAATGQNSATVSVTQTMTDCAVVSDAEEVWVFNGNPNIRYTASVTTNQEDDFTFTTTQTGGFAWVSEDAEKEGTCRITLNLSVTGNATVGNFSATLTGSVCGVQVEEAFSYSPA